MEHNEYQAARWEAMMEPDPITQIQQEKDFEDIGKSAYLMKKGAMEAGASDFEAHMILVAWFSGMSNQIKEEDEDASS